MKTFILALACLMLSVFVKAQFLNLPKLELEPFAKGFFAPMDVTNAGDDRLFVVERLGKIWTIDANGNKLTNLPFLDITDRVFTVFPNDYDERGLLGLTFHPNYPASPYFYVNYIGLDSNSHISRFTVDPNNPNRAMKFSEVLLLLVRQPKRPAFVNHKAGTLKFGHDGYLYVSFGDGGYADDPFNNAQDPLNLLGKMVRIDVDHPDPARGTQYSIPPDNPFVGVPKFKKEIWATGLRHPFRWSFDRKTGDLWIPDVGQNKWEEINMHLAGMKGGQNYGWSCYEANHNFKINGCDYNGTPYTFPIVEYRHTINPCGAIIGGYVYRGSQFPKMSGKYIYCDYCTGRFSIVFKQNFSWVNLYLLDEDDNAYVGFGEDSQGELYVVNTVSGEIEHVVDESAEEMISKSDAVSDLNLRLYPNPNHGQFTIELNTAQKQTYVVTVSNSFGQTVISETKPANSGANRWTFSSRLQKGVYLLSIQTAKGSKSQTFVVE